MPKCGSRKQRGGTHSPSAAGYVYSRVGDGWTQFQNALTLQPGQNLGTLQSNDIEPIGQPNFQSNQAMPSSQNLSLIQSAGKRMRNKRTRKGGSWVDMLSRAAVPFTLLGIQNMYGKNKSRKSKGGRKSRRTRRTKRSKRN